MSLAITVKVPEGLVIAADSRVTYPIPNATGGVNFITFDNATKLLSFKDHIYVGAVTFGAGNIGNRTASSFAPEFIATLEEDRLSINDFSNKMSEFYMEKWNETMPEDYEGEPMIFNIAGFDEGEPHGKIFSFNIPNLPKPKEEIKEGFNILFGGDTIIVERLINGSNSALVQLAETLIDDDKKKEELREAARTLAPELYIPGLSLQDGVKLALTLVRSTIDLQSLQFSNRSVGGSIDLAVLTPEDGIKFIQKKSIVGESS